MKMNSQKNRYSNKQDKMDEQNEQNDKAEYWDPKQYWMTYEQALGSIGDMYLAQDLNAKGQKHYNALQIDDVTSLIKKT